MIARRLINRWVVAGIILAVLIVASSFVMARSQPVYYHDDEHGLTCYTLGGRAISCFPDPAP